MFYRHGDDGVWIANDAISDRFEVIVQVVGFGSGDWVVGVREEAEGEDGG